MPVFEAVETYPVAVERLFAFFRRPADVLAAAPPGAGLRLLDAPGTVEAGSTVTVQARRWGLSVRIVAEVTELVPGELVAEEQRRGPFARWRLVRRFRPISPRECELRETVEYEPPGGFLGLTLTAVRIEAELRVAYQGRRERVLALIDAQESADTGEFGGKV